MNSSHLEVFPFLGPGLLLGVPQGRYARSGSADVGAVRLENVAVCVDVIGEADGREAFGVVVPQSGDLFNHLLHPQAQVGQRCGGGG